MKQQNAIKALLKILKKEINNFISVIEQIEDDKLDIIIDTETKDSDCSTFRNIIWHTISAGHGYIYSIQTYKSISNKTYKTDYSKDDLCGLILGMNNSYTYSEDTLLQLEDNDLSEYDCEKKLVTSWGQYYDIEQLMEHAILHIMRHKIQIEHFLQIEK